MRNTFGWSPAQLGLASAVQRAEGSITTPLAGYLIHRYGPRFVVMVGMFILGLGFVVFSRVNELWHFYAALLIMAAGTGLAGWLPLDDFVEQLVQQAQEPGDGHIHGGPLRGGFRDSAGVELGRGPRPLFARRLEDCNPGHRRGHAGAGLANDPVHQEQARGLRPASRRNSPVRAAHGGNQAPQRLWSNTRATPGKRPSARSTSGGFPLAMR